MQAPGIFSCMNSSRCSCTEIQQIPNGPQPENHIHRSSIALHVFLTAGVAGGSWPRARRWPFSHGACAQSLHRSWLKLWLHNHVDETCACVTTEKSKLEVLSNAESPLTLTTYGSIRDTARQNGEKTRMTRSAKTLINQKQAWAQCLRK